MRYLRFIPLVGLLFTVSLTTRAQQSAQGSPVIVVFKDGAPFQAFAPNFRADDRAAASPEAWGYLDRGVAGTVQTLENQQGFRAEHVYSSAIRGFSARLTARQIQNLRNDPMVASIETDGEMAIVAQVLPWGIDRIDADVSTTLAGNGSGAVTNVHVYVIDTGVDTAHQDLNVAGIVNFAGGPKTDCNGHGTHVAGTIAAKDNSLDVVGVVPGAPVTGVKVLGCNGSGSTSGVIKGIDWVTANAVKPAIANMSLGGSVSASLDTAVINSAAKGVFYSLAAGNNGTLACNSSPARVGAGTDNGIVTTAATDSANNEASWSNYGSCVDIWAPGVGILSTRKGGGSTTMSGTSMASPHTGGAGALYLSGQPAASPTQVEQMLKAKAITPGTTSKSGGLIKLLNAATF